MKINEKKIEATFDEPQSGQAIEFQDDFDKTMLRSGINLVEVDEQLNEEEFSLKKKIWNLSKMESLVHSDPKLSAVYDKMAEEGKERFGYHYNETILNIIFNDYVLNDPTYLQKYKQAIPKEKKRRDKSGINQIKKDYEELQDKREKHKKEKQKGNNDIKSLNERVSKLYTQRINETTPAASSGAYFTKAGNKENYESNTIDTEKEWEDLNDPDVAEIAREDKMKDKGKQSTSAIDDSNLVGGSNAKPTYPGGEIVKNNNNTVLNESTMNDLESAKTQAQKISKEEGVAQHVNQISDNKYKVSDWYDADKTIASYENGRQMNENKNTEENEESVDETTSASSAAGAGSSYVGYAGPVAWGSGDLTQNKGKKTKKDKNSFWKGGEVIKESDYLTDSKGFERFVDMLNESINEDMSREQKIKFISNYLEQDDQSGYPLAPMNWLSNLDDSAIDTLYDNIENNMSGQQLNEKAKSEAQQQAAGIALSAKRGDMDVSKLQGSAKEMYDSMSEKELDDFASTKHDNIPKKVQESGEEVSFEEIYNEQKQNGKSSEEAAEFVLDIMTNGVWAGMEGEEINNYKKQIIDKFEHGMEINENPMLKALGTAAASGFGGSIGNRVADKVGLEEDHNFSEKDKIKYILKAWEMLIPNFNEEQHKQMLVLLPSEKLELFYKTTEDMLRNRDIDPHSINVDQENKKELEFEMQETMIDAQEDSMKMNPPVNTQGSDFPTGMQISNVVNESEEFLKKINKELKLYEMYNKKIQEERKPSSLVMKDRLGDENQKNFKKDLKHSGTKDIIDTTKELEWEDQQTDVKDPQKLSKDIEKQHLKNTGGGESLENEGNSTNNKGDEIPKRNLTDEEANEVDLYRKGLSDWVFDNKPDERYEERMKRDMGDKIYKERQQTMDLEAEAPMYNKDTQPYEKGIKKDQFDKEKTGWNDRLGINEGTVIGKYYDDNSNTKFFDFNLKDVTEVAEINESMIPLNLKGMGNSYSKKFELNESISNMLDSWNFYLQENKVLVHKPVKKLNESEEKDENNNLNEQFSKMKHLLGYKPKDFINTKNNKI